jgi:D-tyrosyl-tRNA(Tyr) deacylase
MKLLIQRVSAASITVDGEIVGAIDSGVLVFVGVTHKDTEKEAEWLAQKLANLRIFEDAEGKMNRSLLEQGGKALIVSQFTLYANCSEGRRPSFIEAANPELGKKLYEKFIQEMVKNGVAVETGVFGAMMGVSLVNNGPVTLCIERLPVS